MKKAFIFLTLIIGIISFFGACSSDDDSSSTSTSGCAGSSALTEVTSCSSTASGTITGIDNMSISGTMSTFHLFGIQGGYGVDNSTDCIDNSTLISTFAASIGQPTDASGLIINYPITSSSSYAQIIKFYSDTSCSTEVASFTAGFTGLTVGDNVSGLSTSVSGSSSTFSSTATKVSYEYSCIGVTASTDAGATWLKTFLSGTDPVVGTSYSCAVSSPVTYYGLAYTDNTSSYGQTVIWEESTSGYPSDWSSSASSMTFLE